MSEPNVNAIPSARAAGRSRTHKVTVTAMLSAVAFVLMFIEFPIPALIPAFVKLDISDLPELLAAFSLGPVYGVVVAFLKNLLFAVLHGTSSAYVGELFNFLMGSVFAFSAGFVYRRNKSRRGALLGAVIGTLLMAVLSVPLNYFVVYPAARDHHRDVSGHPSLGRRSARMSARVQYALHIFQGPARRGAVLFDLQAALPPAAQVKRLSRAVCQGRPPFLCKQPKICKNFVQNVGYLQY